MMSSVSCMCATSEQIEYGEIQVEEEEQQFNKKCTFVAYTLTPIVLGHAGTFWYNKLHPISNESKV